MSTVVFEELNGVGRIGLNRGAQHNALGKAELAAVEVLRFMLYPPVKGRIAVTGAHYHWFTLGYVGVLSF